MNKLESDKKAEKRSLLFVHFSVLLFGVAGIFAKVIDLPAVIIVIGRVFFASITLAILIKLQGSVKIAIQNKKNFKVLLLMGAILAFHWFTFFHSIQLSTVAIGLLTFATFPLFTVFLEPWLLREKFELKFMLLALIALFGIFLIVPEFNFQNAITRGALWGLLSGLSFSFLIILNRAYVSTIPAIKIAFYQDLFALIFLLPFLFFIDYSFHWQNVALLLLLGTVFTAFAHLLYIKSLDRLNARTVSIISSLEPVYGILIAWLLLSEVPDLKTILGGLIVLSCVMYLSMQRKASRRSNISK